MGRIRDRKLQAIYRRRHYARHGEAVRAKVLARNLRVRSERRAFVDALKEGKPCTDCGRTFKPWQMDWDHLRDKKDNVATLVRNGASEERIMQEIEKCELVCANCHRDRTHSRLYR